MTIRQTYGPEPASAILCLNDLDTSSSEPRVYDLTLARVLGYEHSRNVRRLIKTSRAELETHGELIEVSDRSGGNGNLLSGGANRVTPKAGRPGTAFYLNEGQALVICALTRTATAAKVRGELIRVFMLYRAGRLRFSPLAVTDRLAPAERKALQAMIRNADVVMVPRAFPQKCGYDVGIDGIGHDPSDGTIPYILAPITYQILDTLAAFEADLAELEDGADCEPDQIPEFSDDDVEGDDSCDAEYSGDENEPSLGSCDQYLDQRSWSAGGHDLDLEEQCEDEGAQCDDEGHDSDSEASLGALEAGDGPQTPWFSDAAADLELEDYARPRRAVIPAHVLLSREVTETRNAARRLRELVARLQSGEAREAMQ